MKFDKGDLVFDPRLNMTGMVMSIEEKLVGSIHSDEMLSEFWYNVMLFGDSWCAKGNTRDYTVNHGDNLLEAYNEEEHKGLLRDEAEHDVDELSRVFLDI
jgi:hypothetical protein